MPFRTRIWVAPLFLGLLGLLFHLSPLGATLNNKIQDWRMGHSVVHPTGRVVFVAVDSRSLRDVGTWPWSRAIHASILDRLVDANAADILFDIDFSAARDAAGDARFASALDRAGGATFLATFAQNSSNTEDAPLAFNLPLGRFFEVSWPAAVNVTSDRDGLIRRYLSGVTIDGEFVPTAAALLAGGALREGEQFGINFAISPHAIPTVSAADILAGTFDTADIQGRSVIIGSSALELGDFHAVPVHQVIPGALIHAVAAETMMADVAVRWAHPVPLALFVMLSLLLLNRRQQQRPWQTVGAIGCLLVALEILALYLFRQNSLALPTGFAHPMAVLFAISHLATALKSNLFLLVRKERQIENTETLLAHVFDQSSDGIVVVSETGEVLMHSRSALKIFGAADDAELSLPPQIWQAVDAALYESDHEQQTKLQTLDLPGPMGGRSLEFLTAPSLYRDLNAGTDAGAEADRRIATVSVRDVTALKQREREIAYLSTHDERTGAMRRGPFLEFLRLRMSSAAPLGILVLNLHRFKSINITMGRETGDAILCTVVERLQALEEGLSAVARLDGDSFALFTELPCTLERMSEVVEKVRQCVCEPYTVDGATPQVGVNIGYDFLHPDDRVEPEDALARAEEALDHARTVKAAAVCRYDPKMAQKRIRMRAIERELPEALQREEFFVVYQPQHRLSDGKLVGAEALVRWDSPTLGLVYPDEFIPIAEATGLIVELGRQVLFQAVRDATDLPADMSVAVNVSGIQIKRGDIAADVAAALNETGLAPARLCLELTESVMLDRVDDTIEIMRDITWSGVTWALDDFGTGFSSFAYLTRLPLTKIKLDKAFTTGLGSDPAADAILHSVATLCRGLGLSLLCEGVETAEHVAILHARGCSEGQGFFYGKPKSAAELIAGPRAENPSAKGA